MVIINALGNNCIYSGIVDNLSVDNLLYICAQFASEHYIIPKEVLIITNGKLIKIDLESVIQSELEKQLQEKQYEKN